MCKSVKTLFSECQGHHMVMFRRLYYFVTVKVLAEETLCVTLYIMYVTIHDRTTIIHLSFCPDESDFGQGQVESLKSIMHFTNFYHTLFQEGQDDFGIFVFDDWYLNVYIGKMTLCLQWQSQSQVELCICHRVGFYVVFPEIHWHLFRFLYHVWLYDRLN